jgi:hypothetical protein
LQNFLAQSSLEFSESSRNGADKTPQNKLARCTNSVVYENFAKEQSIFPGSVSKHRDRYIN